jgi:hypothetical protein
VAAPLELGEADLVEQAAQKPGELHGQTVPGVREARHRLARDAQAVLAGDLAWGLADPEKLTEAGVPLAWKSLNRTIISPDR